MKKLLYLAPLFIALIALPFFSCSTPPPAPEETPTPVYQPATEPEPVAPQGPTLTNDLNAAIAKVEAARQRAEDFEGPDYFPSDWEAAEAQYANAKALPQTNDPDIRQAIAAYNDTATAYDSIFDLTIPLYAQAREDEIMAIWDELVAAGARDAFPEYFAPADATAILAYEQYEAEDYYAARDSAAKALGMYQTFKPAYIAWLTREEIIKKEFDLYSPDDFNRGDQAGIAANGYYEAGAYAEAQAKAEDALQQYETVLTQGWRAYAVQYSLSAADKRQIALNNKANIATRNIFNDAESRYRSAGVALNAQNYEEAANQYINAENLFVAATNSTIEKRDNAAEAIIEANERIVESDETARQADTIMVGGQQ
jgi:tetratricopeptide (TPR) repeat protein